MVVPDECNARICVILKYRAKLRACRHCARPGMAKNMIFRAGARARWLCLAGAIAVNTEASPKSGTMFADACTAGDRIVIAAVGDLIFQSPIQKQIDDRRRTYRFGRLSNLFLQAPISSMETLKDLSHDSPVTAQIADP